MAWDVEYSDSFADSWKGTAMAQKFDKLFRKMSPEARKRVEERANTEYQALALAELREAQDLTQVQLAEKLGIDQGAVSKIERRTDMYLSTLRNIIQAMGGQLELTARFPTGRAQVLAFRDSERSGKKHGKQRSSRTIRKD
jgi:DNA-binding XRE family transcriptional regulator